MTMVHRPADETALAALIREAPIRGAVFRIVGGGEWLSAGAPVSATAERLELGAFSGIEQFRAEDLTITVGAATTLAELDRTTTAHGLWCPLHPWGSNRGTVGATIATASEGPSNAYLGRPRDLVLGLDAVDGTGAHLRVGGRVVKNVAGFDLTRLLTGSWGTLGVLTRVHLRLRARPKVEQTLAIRLLSTQDVAAFDTWRRGPLAPLASFVIPATGREALPALGEATHLVRIGGNAAFTEASVETLGRIATTWPHESSIWDAVRERFTGADRALAWRDSALSASLRDRFDPHRLLNPGILGVR